MEFKPHEYQQICIDHLERTPKGGLFLDCGMGKTVVTLTHIWSLLYDRFEDINKVLVIAPKKVAEDTWTNEAQKWDHLKDLTFSKILGTPKKRLKALEQDADIYLINRENVPWLVAGFGKKWPFDMIVVDELSSFKSADSDRFRALKRVIDINKVKYFVGLTGTPQPNGLGDLWSQVYLMDQGERLGETIGKYRSDYFSCYKRSSKMIKDGKVRTITFTDYVPLEGAEEQVHEKLKDIIISLEAKDWLNVPEATYIYHTVKLDKKERDLVKTLTKEKAIQLYEDAVPIVASNAGQISYKLLQMANGAVYDVDHGVQEIHKKKLEALEDLIESANGKPVMVFYWFQHDRERILRHLAKKKLRITDLKTSEERSAWNRGEYDMALAQPESMGHGLNLQDGGNIIIWFSMIYSLETYIQANARLHRQGQKQKVLIHHLVAEGTHDEDVIAVLNDKGESQSRLIEALKARLKIEREGV